MIQELPIGEMEWCDDLSYKKTKEGEENYGYVYEVDLIYPDEIKENTKYYPFCPENIKPDVSKFSDYQKEHLPKHYRPSEKLILTQTDKKNYIVEGRMLDWLLDHGMKLERVHKKLIYKKSKWLKNYIEFNIEKRKIAKANKDANGRAAPDKFGDTFFKLMNNAFYGKTLENVRNRQNIEVVYNGDRFKQLSRKPTYKRTTMFSNEVVAVHLKRANVKHDKFNYIGFTILELAKLFMYSFVYDYVEPAYGQRPGSTNGNNYKLHYTDTDSFFLELVVPFDSSLDIEIEKIKDIIHPNDLCKVKDESGKNDYIKDCLLYTSPSPRD